MANLFAPYGLRQSQGIPGVPFNFGNATDKIQASYTTPIYRGDPVIRAPSGYLIKAPAGSFQIHGIFDGCRYLSAVKGYTNYSPFFPGNGDPLADAAAMVITQPQAVFQCQTGNSATSAVTVNQSMVDLNIGIAYGTPNPRTGISAAYLDLSTIGTSNSLPFKIVQLVSDPPGVNGADLTTPFGDLLVTFNNADLRAGTTGI